MTDSWQQITVGAVCEVIAGQSPPGQFYNADGNGTPFYQGKKDFGEKFLRPPSTWTTKATKLARSGDILMSVRAPVGPVNFASSDACIGRGLAAIRSGDALEPDFLYYQLLHLQPEIAGTEGAVFASINKSEIEALPITIAPKMQQQRIVDILDEAFAGIATAKANAEKNLQNARAIFESQLAALFANAENWPRRTLREIAVDFGRGKSKHRPRNDPKLYGGPYPFIQTGDVRGARHLITSFNQTYSEAGLAQSKLWPKGTLCITIAANIAETGVLDFDACFPDSVIGVVVNERKTSIKFVGYLLQTVKADLKSKGKGSAQDNINLGTFERERYPFPDLAMQLAIVKALDSLSADVQRLESIYQRKLDALDALKQSLLHRAFSGQL